MAPTRAQLEAEVFWRREVSPPTLVALGHAMRAHFGVSPVAVGIKGDEHHLSGGHRSPDWILRSRYSTRGSADGSLITSSGGRATAFETNLRALDITPGPWGTAENRRRMSVMSSRLNDALRAGRVPQVRRFWGTLDGRSVYGWDTWLGRTTTADSSHLDHIHIEMYPDRVQWDHSGVFAVLTGGDDDMLTPTQQQQLTNVHAWLHGLVTGATTGSWPHTQVIAPNVSLAQLGAAAAASAQREQDLAAAIEALASGGTSVDTAAIIAHINARTTDVTGQIDALRAELNASRAREQRLQSALAAAGVALADADDQ